MCSRDCQFQSYRGLTREKLQAEGWVMGRRARPSPRSAESAPIFLPFRADKTSLEGLQKGPRGRKAREQTENK